MGQNTEPSKVTTSRITWTRLAAFLMGFILIWVIFHHFFYNPYKQYNHLSRFSTEERLEDFEYLVSVLQENYPFFGVAQRTHRIDWLGNIDSYAKRIENSTNDVHFIDEMYKIMRECAAGHTEPIVPGLPPIFLNIYQGLVDEHSHLQAWVDVLNSPSVIANDPYWVQVMEEVQGPQYLEMLKQRASIESGLHTEILSANGIDVPYIRVSSFWSDNVSQDKEPLYQFLQEVKDYPHLVIDIRGNTGGSDLYWLQNIVQPLVTESLTAKSLTTTHYTVYKGGDLLHNFFPSLELQEISHLPAELSPPPEVADFAFFQKAVRTIHADPEHTLDYKGHIYLLVDNRVASAADAFSAFAKSTGWAMVIGTRTRGDGLAGDPVIFVLPNSGLLFRFDIGMTLTPAGHARYERGTTPDVIVYNEDALNKALAINKRD